MKIICGYCGRDINAIGQDNVSYNNMPMCEDCASTMREDYDDEIEEVEE